MILAWPWFALALALPLLVRFGLPRSLAPAAPGWPMPASPCCCPRAWAAPVAHGPVLVCPGAGPVPPPVAGAPLIHYQASRDLILAVDLSDSMRTQDMLDEGEQRDRLSAVRQQIAQLIGERPGDRIALIVFADHAYLLSP